VNANLAGVDARIVKFVENFGIARLAAVDRNILRLAIYEMFHCMETPPVVAINEAIEIARKFGGEDSSRFVNGVLDKIKGELTRPLREAAAPRGEGKGT
jgi:transcription antitermination factor NusB